MFSWQIWDANLTDNSKIGDEFEQNKLSEVTPDFKDQKIETEATKTCNTSFLSLKRPDFKYVIFKIVEVS